MPSRMIREGLLDSERYWSCTIEARELFFHITLLADDFGCVSMSPALIGRRCFDVRPTAEKMARLITQLCDADLLRQYQSGGSTYAFIPRFGQRLRRFTLKHPRPPDEVISGDKRALKLFNRINENNQSMSDDEPSHDGHSAAEEKGREVEGKRKEVEVKVKPVDNSGQPKIKPDEIREGKTYAQWLIELAIPIKAGWSAAEAKLAVDQILDSRKANA